MTSPTSTKNQVITAWRKPRTQYEVKGDAVVLGKVKKAKDLANALKQIATDVEGKQHQRTDTFDHMVNLFTGQHELGLDPKKRYTNFDAKSAKPADIIFRVMGMLDVEPRFQYVHPFGVNREKAADAIEAHLNNFPRWYRRRMRHNPRRQALFWRLLLGQGPIQQTYDPFVWDHNEMSRKDGEGDADYLARRDAYRGYMGPPFRLQALDPRLVFPVPGPFGPDGWVKIYQVERFELESAFERLQKGVQWSDDGQHVEQLIDLGKPAGRILPAHSEDSAGSTVEYIEYIDDVYAYYVVDGKVVHRYEHRGGIAIIPSYGLQTGFEEYHLQAMGVLWAVRNEIPQLDFLRTLWAQRAYLAVFPPLFAILGENDEFVTDPDTGKPRSWDLKPGTVEQVRGNLVNALKEMGADTDFQGIVSMLAGDIDLATLPSLARGIAGAQQPGYAINQLTQSMRTLWKPAVESAEDQEAALGTHYIHVAKELIGEPLRYYAESESPATGQLAGDWFELDPEKVEEFHEVRAFIDPELPIDKAGERLSMWNLFKEGGATWEDYVRDGLGKTNPAAYFNQVVRDRARVQFIPEALEMALQLGRVRAMQHTADLAGLNKLNSLWNADLEALRQARAQAAANTPARNGQGGPPGPGTPGEPGAGPGVVDSTAGQSGGGIEPTVGANPNDPYPGPRTGDVR